MKRFFLSILFIAFMSVCFTSQAFAFGSRHHTGPGGVNGGYGSGSTYEDGNSGGGNHPSLKNDNTDTTDPKDDKGSKFDKDCKLDGDKSSDPEHPSPVPEPMTLSLMGMGLAGVLLKRKMGQ